MRVTLIATVKHDGKLCSAGAEVDIDAKSAAALLAVGVAIATPVVQPQLQPKPTIKAKG